MWSSEEEAHIRSGHFWISKFGTVPGNMSYVEKKFELTFQEWDPSAGTDDTRRGVSRRPSYTRRDSELQGVGNSTFVLSVENDNGFRSRCE